MFIQVIPILKCYMCSFLTKLVKKVNRANII